MASRLAEKGAIEYALTRRTQKPETRLGLAGYIQGIVSDDFALTPKNPYSRLTAKGRIMGEHYDYHVENP